MKIGAEMTLPRREFLGFCESVEDYARGAEPGREVIGFTSGEFSIVDVILAVVARMDRPRLVISTWTAAGADMGHVFDWLEESRVSAARWIVDRSFQNRQPDLCNLLRARFGDDACRVQRVHCKFVLLQDGERTVVIQTSANMNRNARIENVSVSSCPVLFEAYAGLVEDIFGTQMPGAGFESDRHVTASFKAVTNKPDKKKKTIANPFGKSLAG